MLQTPRATRGMVVAPHHLAAQAGLRVLHEGGNAIEAMVAAASTVAVVYPHMNSLGGDNFWLVYDGTNSPVGIDACGAAASAATPDFYRRCGYSNIPSRGPLAANTVSGVVSGWQTALALSRRWGGTLPLSRLLEDAEYYARTGCPVTRSQHANTTAKRAELDVPGFAETFLENGRAPAIGSLFKQPALAQTLARLARAGLDDFYRGELAQHMAAELLRLDSPLRVEDLASHGACEVQPLSVRLRASTVYNLPPPTQGLASLLVLALFDRLQCKAPETFEYVHLLVEATKCAFRVRDAHVTDPAYMTVAPGSFLTDRALEEMRASIDPRRAAPWATGPASGDTVWLGAIDARGRAVSFIQSIYWEFGSGVVLTETGILWQNRGTSFKLEEGAHNLLVPGRKPFHTIQPAMALLDDGRAMVYGTMGGEGQPQTQAAVFSRYALFDQELQRAVTAPRWLLGRTWGTPKTTLRIENRFAPEVLAALEAAGHDLERVGAFDEAMGHAGAIVRRASSVLEGAADPRGDGAVAAF
jgi:gamma-glutamyltranspeptidase